MKCTTTRYETPLERANKLLTRASHMERTKIKERASDMESTAFQERSLWGRLNPPKSVREDQLAYDRRALYWRMYNVTGCTLAEISKKYGPSRERIRQIIMQFERERRRRSPIERWLDGWRVDLWHYLETHKHSFKKRAAKRAAYDQ